MELLKCCNYGICNYQRKNRFFIFCILVWNIRRFVGDLISNCVIMEFVIISERIGFFTFCIGFVGDLISN